MYIFVIFTVRENSNISDYSVIGNTVDFDSAIAGSNPAGPSFIVIVFSDYF